MTTIRSLSVAARVVLDLHALNNEGTESNRIMARHVGIVTPTYNDDRSINGFHRSVVNAISGDMNKHIFTDYFRHLAIERELGICEACKSLDPARMMGNPDFRLYLELKPNAADVVDRLLTCSLDDIAGIMITGSGRLIKRKSAVEFGWTVGLPDASEIQEFIHNRHAYTRVTQTGNEKAESQHTSKSVPDKSETNLSQMVFTRPASSGVYAFVAHLDASAIGFNDIRQQYPISAEERGERFRASLLAIAQTLFQPRGSSTSTQLPHVVDIEGFVSISHGAAVAPLISPLAEDYIQRSIDIAHGINRLHGKDAIEILPFVGGEGLLTQLATIAETGTPGKSRE